jgi:hypothetical protein
MSRSKPPEMCCHAVSVIDTTILEEPAAFIFRVEDVGSRFF